VNTKFKEQPKESLFSSFRSNDIRKIPQDNQWWFSITDISEAIFDNKWKLPRLLKGYQKISKTKKILDNNVSIFRLRDQNNHRRLTKCITKEGIIQLLHEENDQLILLFLEWIENASTDPIFSANIVEEEIISEPILYPEFGKLLAQSREKTGWSYSQAASNSNISRGYYINIEKGKKMPSLPVFLRILDTLKLDINKVQSLF